MVRKVFALFSAVMLAGGVVVAGTGTAAGGLSNRDCATTLPFDNHYFSICTRLWRSDTGAAATRGVAEMHWYINVNGYWIDQTAQTMTVNRAKLYLNGSLTGPKIPWGNDIGADTCRVNSQNGPIACSVPHVARVAFYSKAWAGTNSSTRVCLEKWSWRDEHGKAWIYDNLGDLCWPET